MAMDIIGIIGVVPLAAGVRLATLERSVAGFQKYRRAATFLEIYGWTEMGATVVLVPAKLADDIERIRKDPELTDTQKEAMIAQAKLGAVMSGLMMLGAGAAETAHPKMGGMSEGETSALKQQTELVEMEGLGRYKSLDDPDVGLLGKDGRWTDKGWQIMGGKPGKEGTVGTTGLTRQELNVEMQKVRDDLRSGEFQKSTEPGYDIEIKTRAEDGEHTWRTKEGEENRLWCRFGSPIDCFDPDAVTGEHHIFQLRTEEIYNESGDHPIVIAETPLGPGARYRRTGEGDMGEVPTPGQPVVGDWVPYYGHAKIMRYGELEEILMRHGITFEQFESYSPQAREAVLRNVLENAPMADWFIKPRSEDRWGETTYESNWNRGLSSWLRERFPEPPQANIVTDVRLINDWLRSRGIRVGGQYNVGDVIPLDILW
jgi:hypothetical protein